MRRFTALIVASALALTAASVAAPSAAEAAPTRDGKEWRELYETTGLSAASIATVCPRDGITPCAGTVGGRNLTGWVWATAPQVRDLMDDYAPELATAEPPVVSGINGFWAAIAFLGEMRYTGYFASTYSYSEFASGWTASTDPNGLPIGAGASYGHALAGSTADGSLGLGASADRADQYTGVFLWRTAGLDYTPPTVTPSVSGTLGTNGWYRSNVAVSWTVADAESPIDTSTGCGPSSVVTDTAGVAFTCTATSFGGTASGTVSIKRDATPPTIVCATPAPTFSLGSSGSVIASVSDAGSGVNSPTVSGPASTTTAGAKSVTLAVVDRAGNSNSTNCPYTVTVPLCQGKTPTRIGTAGNDVITGTGGADVILALGGNDTIDGAGGADTICAGDGADLVYGGPGIDKIDGGAGNDDLNGGGAADDLNGGPDSDSIRGDAGADRCTSGEVRMSSCAYLY